jgi:hypothetical protein
MQKKEVEALALWIAAAWLVDCWDRFPHVCISSPEKRCGKTTLLELLHTVVPRPLLTSNISPAALYRAITQDKPTLIMDEAQSLNRLGSEQSEVIREILLAGIGKGAKVIRCGGERFDTIQEFSVYGPKVFALIGDPDAVLADRCLTIRLSRKTKDHAVDRFRSRKVEAEGQAIREELQRWAEQHRDEVLAVYDATEPFPIENDRMADLLTPLQAIAQVVDSQTLAILECYAQGLDERDREMATQTPGIRLLMACREIFGTQHSFISTDALIKTLEGRREEPWHRWHRGACITREALANLLRQFGIKSCRNKTQTQRGYAVADFKDAWGRFLPPPSPSPKNPAIPPSPAKPTGDLRKPTALLGKLKAQKGSDDAKTS